MCAKVYRTYAYLLSNIILLGSIAIAVVNFIGAIILTHTHIYMHLYEW